MGTHWLTSRQLYCPRLCFLLVTMSTLEDSLEEFDIRYTESCNQIINGPQSLFIPQRTNSIVSDSEQRMKLSSPLSNHQELYFTTSSSPASALVSPRNSDHFDIYTEHILPSTRPSTMDRPPLKPSVTIASIDNYSKFEKALSLRKTSDGFISKPQRRASANSNVAPHWSKTTRTSGRSSSLTSGKRPSLSPSGLSLDMVANSHATKISDKGSDKAVDDMFFKSTQSQLTDNDHTKSQTTSNFVSETSLFSLDSFLFLDQPNLIDTHVAAAGDEDILYYDSKEAFFSNDY